MKIIISLRFRLSQKDWFDPSQDPIAKVPSPVLVSLTCGQQDVRPAARCDARRLLNLLRPPAI